MKRIAVVGCKGRMGSLITKELQKEFDVVGVDREDCLEDLKSIDILIDFSNHEKSVESAEFCRRRNIPMILGTTGQTLEELQKLEKISRHITLVKKANFSRGMRVLEGFIENVVELKPQRFEIIEKHHKNKKDSPSGTAIELEKFIKEKFSCEVEIKSIREGEEMGEHKIVAFVGDEKLEIKHNALSRDIFVLGVVQEVKKILKMI